MQTFYFSEGLQVNRCVQQQTTVDTANNCKHSKQLQTSRYLLYSYKTFTYVTNFNSNTSQHVSGMFNNNVSVKGGGEGLKILLLKRKTCLSLLYTATSNVNLMLNLFHMTEIYLTFCKLFLTLNLSVAVNNCSLIVKYVSCF